MSEHPIEGLMLTAMNSIEDMIDVNCRYFDIDNNELIFE